MGTQMAISDIFDDIHHQLYAGKYVVLAVWDFSNCFCTFDHERTEDVAKMYNFSPEMMQLFSQFLRQNNSTIKISDKNGFHFSDETDMRRGCQQGAIGSDVVFAMVNEGFMPSGVENRGSPPYAGEQVIIIRRKFVDDWTCNYASKNASDLFARLRFNEN